MNKIISYIGFAIKSKKVIVGQTMIKSSKNKIYLVLVCNTASQNLIDLGHSVAKKHDCPVIITKESLDELTHIKDVKIVGLLDENLSKAIFENKEKISID